MKQPINNNKQLCENAFLLDTANEEYFNNTSVYDLVAAIDTAEAMNCRNKEAIRITLIKLVMKKIDQEIAGAINNKELLEVRRQMAMQSHFHYISFTEEEHDLLRNEYNYDSNFDHTVVDRCRKCKKHLSHAALTNGIRLHGQALCFECTGGKNLD